MKKGFKCYTKMIIVKLNRGIAPNEDRFEGYSSSLREDTVGS